MPIEFIHDYQNLIPLAVRNFLTELIALAAPFKFFIAAFCESLLLLEVLFAFAELAGLLLPLLVALFLGGALAAA